MIRIISFVSLYAFYLICMYGQVEYVTTIHPFYELVNNIVGERGLVKEILPPGA
jgi:ABC-type Zn uptake system ZnuABC Zn-binding protein ZnuA